MERISTDNQLSINIKKADKGDIVLVGKLFDDYSISEEITVDYDRAVSYGLLLANQFPNEIPFYNKENYIWCYLSIFHKLGILYASKGKYKTALKWFNKSLDYTYKYFLDEADELIFQFKLYQEIKRCKYWSKHTMKDYFQNFRDEFLIKYCWKWLEKDISSSLKNRSN